MFNIFSSKKTQGADNKGEGKEKLSITHAPLETPSNFDCPSKVKVYNYRFVYFDGEVKLAEIGINNYATFAVRGQHIPNDVKNSFYREHAESVIREFIAEGIRDDGESISNHGFNPSHKAAVFSWIMGNQQRFFDREGWKLIRLGEPMESFTDEEVINYFNQLDEE